MKPRNYRNFHVPTDLVLAILNWRHPKQAKALKYKMPVLVGMPSDASVVNVSASERYGDVLITVQHPSFDNVPLGQQIPVVPSTVEWIDLKEAVKELDGHQT